MNDPTKKLEAGELRIDVGERSYVVRTNGDAVSPVEDISVVPVRDGLYSILYRGKSICAVVEDRGPDYIRFSVDNEVVTLRIVDHRRQLLEEFGVGGEAERRDRTIVSPMPGLVLKLHIEEGQTVSQNDPLLVLEAMKMENELRAPADGVVSAVHVEEGEAVSKNALLIELEPGQSGA